MDAATSGVRPQRACAQTYDDDDDDDGDDDVTTTTMMMASTTVAARRHVHAAPRPSARRTRRATSASASSSNRYAVGVSVLAEPTLPSVGDPMVVGVTIGALAAGAMYVRALRKRLERALRRAARAEVENAELEWRLRVATSSMDPDARAARPRPQQHQQQQQQQPQQQFRGGGSASSSRPDTRDVVIQGLKDEIEALKLTLTATRAESRAERLRAETDDARDILRATRAALDDKN